jgi:hypothetical protein
MLKVIEFDYLGAKKWGAFIHVQKLRCKYFEIQKIKVS